MSDAAHDNARDAARAFTELIAQHSDAQLHMLVMSGLVEQQNRTLAVHALIELYARLQRVGAQYEALLSVNNTLHEGA